MKGLGTRENEIKPEYFLKALQMNYLYLLSEATNTPP